MVHIHSFTFNPFEENTYVLYDETAAAVIIDPGCYELAEQAELKEFITSKKLTVSLLLNTHCHIDHVLGNNFVKKTWAVPFACHAVEIPVLKAVKVYAPNYGFPLYQEILPDQTLQEGVPVTFGNSSLDVIFLPGHSPGHVGFYHAGQKFLIGGDVLFNRSIGRTDLPGGNFDTLINSIHQKLFTLPDNVTVYAGHGPTTTLGDEKMYNPFCALTVS
ncbi:MAG: MBL fold metallo-hydrolase [Cyclobacteriaceae bacterium]|nr:MBL fold metallo-hydrolase [Cyclobacteriaceae bacterium]